MADGREGWSEMEGGRGQVRGRLLNLLRRLEGNHASDEVFQRLSGSRGWMSVLRERSKAGIERSRSFAGDGGSPQAKDSDICLFDKDFRLYAVERHADHLQRSARVCCSMREARALQESRAYAGADT